jgi:UTP-glucose-1-phosphate uridylyltransferase
MALGHFKHVVSRWETRMHDRSSNGELSARFAMGSGHHLRGAVTTAVQPMLVLVDTPVIQCGVEETVRSGVNNIVIVTGRGKNAIEDHCDIAFELVSRNRSSAASHS